MVGVQGKDFVMTPHSWHVVLKISMQSDKSCVNEGAELSAVVTTVNVRCLAV